jgi:Zn-finger protein
VSIPNNIAAQIYTNGPQPCANSACRIYVIDWSRAIFLVNQGGAEVWCCWDCLVQSLAKFIQTQEANRKLFRVDMLERLGYEAGKEEGGK